MRGAQNNVKIYIKIYMRGALKEC